MKSFNTRILLIRTWLLILVPTLSLVQFCAGQGVATRERQTEVEIKILSAELTRFEKPIKIGTGEREKGENRELPAADRGDCG